MNIIVHHAQLIEAPREPFWQLSIEVQHDDGTSERLGHIMPATAVEWRVAQFNVDSETAIKMLIAEPYMKADEVLLPDLETSRSGARQVQAARFDAALSGGDVVFEEGDPPFLFADPDVPQPVLVESGTEAPLQTIVDYSPVSDEHIEVKREFLDAQRAVVQTEAAPVVTHAAANPQWQRESPDDLRAALMPPLPPERPVE